MLFLAVFCGFLAEWQLEHVIENQREKEYIHSIVEDIEEDIAQSDAILNRLNTTNFRIDSLLIELSSDNIAFLAAPREGDQVFTPRVFELAMLVM